MRRIKSSLEKWLIIPDCHIPYEDPKAYSLMLRAARRIKIKNVVVLGDYADFYAVSSHSKDPRRLQNLHWEVERVNERLDELDRLFRGKKIFCAGNHEDRLRRYLQDRAPALFDSVQVEQLFRLKERGWKYVPYNSYTRVGKLYVTHDLGKAGKGAGADAVSAFMHNAAIGHTHRLEYYVSGSVTGETHLGASLGWLGDFDQIEYRHRAKLRREWAHGFGVLYVEKTTGCIHLQPVPVVNGRVVVEGRLVQ